MGNEMLLNKFNGAGDAVCLVLEWLGVSIFAFGYLFCVYEGIVICRIPKTATVVAAESVEVVESQKVDGHHHVSRKERNRRAGRQSIKL